MNANRDVILVDLSNIRDETGEKARTDRGMIRAFSRSYLEGFEAALRSAAPHAHIVLVAGRAIVSKDLWIEGGKRQSTDFKWMKHRTKSKGESDFVYLMQEQKDGEEHVKADDLILHLAHHYDGFIVSNDNYREPHYHDKLREVGHKHFDPKYDHPSDSWSFELKLHDQVDLIKRSAGSFLEECLASFSSLDHEEEEEFEAYLYDILIPDFWSERDNYTLGSKKGITQKIADSSVWRVVNKRQGQISDTKAFVMRGLSAFRTPRLCRREFSNQFVELFGRTRTYDDQIFLEGIPGDKAVLLEGFDEILNPNTGFLQITGKLRFENDQAILKRRSSSVVVGIDMKQALKIVGTPRVMNRNRDDYVRWVMKPLPWQHRKTRTSAESNSYVPPIEVEVDEPTIEVKVVEPKTDMGRGIIGDPLILRPRESKTITSASKGDGEPETKPIKEEAVEEFSDQTQSERGAWEFDLRSKLMIAVSLALISVVAALWLRGAPADNGCQGSNPCIGGSTSSVPVFEPAPSKWIWRSVEKIWVRE